jgi:hypothetical protein
MGLGFVGPLALGVFGYILKIWAKSDRRVQPRGRSPQCASDAISDTLKAR